MNSEPTRHHIAHPHSRDILITTRLSQRDVTVSVYVALPRKCAYVTVEGVEGVKKKWGWGVFKDKTEQTDREICDAVLNQSPSRRGGKN